MILSYFHEHSPSVRGPWDVTYFLKVINNSFTISIICVMNLCVCVCVLWRGRRGKGGGMRFKLAMFKIATFKIAMFKIATPILVLYWPIRVV